MVALKERYLNTFIQATNRFSADRVLRMLDLAAMSEKSACWNGSFSKSFRIVGICICR